MPAARRPAPRTAPGSAPTSAAASPDGTAAPSRPTWRTARRAAAWPTSWATSTACSPGPSCRRSSSPRKAAGPWPPRSGRATGAAGASDVRRRGGGERLGDDRCRRGRGRRRGGQRSAGRRRHRGGHHGRQGRGGDRGRRRPRRGIAHRRRRRERRPERRGRRPRGRRARAGGRDGHVRTRRRRWSPRRIPPRPVRRPARTAPAPSDGAAIDLDARIDLGGGRRRGGRSAVDVPLPVVPGGGVEAQVGAGLAEGVDIDAAWRAGVLGTGSLALDVANAGTDALVGAALVVDLSPGARPTSLLGTSCHATDPGLVGAVLSLLGSLTCDLVALAPTRRGHAGPPPRRARLGSDGVGAASSRAASRWRPPPSTWRAAPGRRASVEAVGQQLGGDAQLAGDPVDVAHAVGPRDRGRPPHVAQHLGRRGLESRRRRRSGTPTA